MRATSILCAIVFAFALILGWSGYAEYTRRPVAPVELTAVPIRAWEETAKRTRPRAVVALGIEPCAEIAFPPKLFDALNAMVGSKVRFHVERTRTETADCDGWSAKSIDKALPGISQQDVIREHEQHALMQLLIGAALAAGAVALLLVRRHQRLKRGRDSGDHA